MASYYQVLGLPDSATVLEVKRAYRSLARKYHPDVNPDTDANEKFQRIEEAYRMIMSGKGRATRWNAYAEAKKRQEEKKRAAQQERIRRARAFAQKLKEQREQSYLETLRRGTTWLLTSIVILFTFYTFDKFYQLFKVNENPSYAWGVITNAKTRNATFEFYVNGVKMENTIYLRKSFTEVVTPNGMPLEEGHEFRVKYNADFPDYSTLDFTQYTPEVAQRYMEMVFAKMRQAPKFKDFSEEALVCFIVEIYREMGSVGLAKLYFFNEPLVENWRYNGLKFAMFKKSELYKRSKQSCLDKSVE
ncbi:MAG: DnaJ domain-containing protein [Cryomorphaceae bacterium]|nr:DnaJ domain-containing protein [Cryomorphaceae bacterium]